MVFLPEPITDSAQLAALHAAAFDAPWDEMYFARALDRPNIHAFGTQEGFILLQVLGGTPCEAEILTLCVHPKARRKGLAQGLIDAAQTKLKAQCLFLEVNENNISACALYRACQFRETGRRKAYYKTAAGGREDALLMRRDFSQ